jgi:hypothetical protein
MKLTATTTMPRPVQLSTRRQRRVLVATARDGRKIGWDDSVRAWFRPQSIQTRLIADGGRPPNPFGCVQPVASSSQNFKSKRQG